MKKSINIPNIITSLRIVGTACLIFIEPMSAAFFIVYTLCGMSDIVDGFIARRTGTVSELGAKLDSIADLMFYAVMLLRIFPVLLQRLPGWIWYIVGGIVFLRICAYLLAALKFKRFSSMHTYLNKVTGGAVFAVPYIIVTPIAVPLCVAVCVIGALSTAEELLIHIIRKEYSGGVKTIFSMK